MRPFIVFDNGGKTPDRFTIINKETGDVFGASEDPAASDGIGKFCGNCADHRIVMFGAGWRQKLPGQKIIKAEAENYINNARLNPGWIGSEVEWKCIPENVRLYISRLDPHHRAGDYSKVNIAYMTTTSTDLSSGAGGQ